METTALTIAANAIRDVARQMEPKPDGCRQCADVEAPLIRELEEIANRLDREARGE